MIDARQKGNTAVLVRDKLYINNKLYQPDDGNTSEMKLNSGAEESMNFSYYH